MSRGQYQPGNQSGRRAFGRCKSKSNIENVVVIDVDAVNLDAPETSRQGSRGLRATSRNTFPSGAIYIDDDEGDADNTPRNVCGDATGKTFCLAASSSLSSKESDSDECFLLVRKRNFSAKSRETMRMYCRNNSSRNRFGLDLTSESSVSQSDGSDSGSASSESDSSDCEIMEDTSGHIREQWERAALKRKISVKDHFGSEDRASASGPSTDPLSTSPEITHDKVDGDNFTDKIYFNYHALETSADPVSTSPEITHDKVDGDNFTDKIYFNHHDSEPSADPVSTSPEVTHDKVDGDNFTDKIYFNHHASEPSADPVSTSAEITHDKVDEDKFTNKIHLDHHEDAPAENSRSSSSDGKEEVSSSVPNKADPHLETNANTCVTDSGPTSGACHEGPEFQNEELISEKCSHNAQSTDETFFDHKRAAFRDLEVPIPGSPSCNSRLQQDVHDGVNFQDKKEEFTGEPSCDTQPRCNLNVDHDVFGFQEKSVSEPSLCDSQLSHGPLPNAGSDSFCNNEKTSPGELICISHAQSRTTEMGLSSHTESEDLPQFHEDLIGERERHKESEEYRRAAEEEWASRLQQLQIQGEEAQRLRKRKKAERLMLDMERRQKQRLEEIRESQKKDEEIINLKEKLRAEVRKELEKMELQYRNVASLLRALGIHVEGGLYPMPQEINAACKRAMRTFHPDRSSRTDIRQQVEAEEKFKLISHLKEKLLPLR